MARLSRTCWEGSRLECSIEFEGDLRQRAEFMRQLETWLQGVPHDWYDPKDPEAKEAGDLAVLIRHALGQVGLHRYHVEVCHGAWALGTVLRPWYLSIPKAHLQIVQRRDGAWTVGRVGTGCVEVTQNPAIESGNFAHIAAHTVGLIATDVARGAILERIEKELQRDPAQKE